jgi:hypothetical protein
MNSNTGDTSDAIAWLEQQFAAGQPSDGWRPGTTELRWSTMDESDPSSYPCDLPEPVAELRPVPVTVVEPAPRTIVIDHIYCCAPTSGLCGAYIAPAPDTAPDTDPAGPSQPIRHRNLPALHAHRQRRRGVLGALVPHPPDLARDPGTGMNIRHRRHPRVGFACIPCVGLAIGVIRGPAGLGEFPVTVVVVIGCVTLDIGFGRRVTS